MDSTRLDRTVGPLAIALVLLAAACSRSKVERLYRGPAFRLAKPAAGDWDLVSNPREFRFPSPLPPPKLGDVRKWKALELSSAAVPRAAMEVYLVRPLSADPSDVMGVLLRRGQRRNLVEGQPKPTLVGGRPGMASIALWRPTRSSSRCYFYCVRVPLEDALWCFVGTASEEDFDAARPHFKTVLNSVRFTFTPTPDPRPHPSRPGLTHSAAAASRPRV